MATQGTVRNPVFAPILFPTSWADPTVAYDLRYYADVEVQVDGTVSSPYVINRNFTGAAGTFYPYSGYDSNGNPVTSIAAAGLYRLVGSGYCKLTGGAGGTITIRGAA